MLITLQRPVYAATLFFLRGGLWVYPLLFLLVVEPRARTVLTVALAWLFGVALSVMVGGYWLRDLPWQSGGRGGVDWSWIRRGLRVCMPLLGASLAFRGIFSVDRYALQAFWGAEAVGVYTFYAGIRSGVQSLMDMGLLAILRPRIISAHQAGRAEEYRQLMKTLTLVVAGVATLLCIIAGIAIFPLLSFVENPVYREHLSTFWVMLGVLLVAAMAEVPHSGLYAKERDHSIVVSTVAGLIVAIALNLVLVPPYGPAGAAVATLIAFMVVGGAKAWYLGEQREL